MKTGGLVMSNAQYNINNIIKYLLENQEDIDDIKKIILATLDQIHE